MNKDRRLNGWILLSSILGIISGLVLLVAGGFVGGVGFLKPEKLLKFDDIIFFVSQDGISKAQKTIFGALLKTEVLYLVIGIIIAVIGLIALTLAIVGLNYAKKRKVVRHRVALLVFSLIPLAVAGCTGFYLFKEFKVLTDNIKYVAYGVAGVFGVITLFNILGVIFGRSEKFMSNDNGKYAFGKSSLRSARANVNNNVNGAVQQPNQNRPQVAPQTKMVRPNPNMQQRPVQVGQNMQSRPQGARPMQPARPMQNARPQQNAQPMARQMPPRTTTNMGQSRPVAHTSQMPPRPMPNQHNMQRNAQLQYCAKCGKKLAPGEKFCSLCGTKVAE